MPDIQVPPEIQEFAHDFLAWIGFGTLVGLMAKAIMPGRDPGGAVATLAMGIGGSIIGCSVLMYFTGGTRISPLSPLGFVLATAGAFMLLFFYRLLSGKVIREGGTGLNGPHYGSYRRRPRVERFIED